MDAIAAVLAIGLAIYLAAGLVTAVVFVICGVTAVQPAPVTIGTRILLLPGAAASTFGLVVEVGAAGRRSRSAPR